MGILVEGSRFRVWDLGFRAWSSGCSARGLRILPQSYEVEGLGR